MHDRAVDYVCIATSVNQMCQSMQVLFGVQILLRCLLVEWGGELVERGLIQATNHEKVHTAPYNKPQPLYTLAMSSWSGGRPRGIGEVSV